MEITSLPFLLFVFLFLVIYQLLPQKLLRIWILIGSLFFYCAISPILSGVLVLSIVANFQLSKSDFKLKNAFAVIFNVGLLLLFKLEPSNFIVPIGISFFSFQALSFIFDNPQKVSFINFANYIAFFPQLIAGPIESYNDLGPQIEQPNKLKHDHFIKGLSFVLKGLVFKLVFADRCGIVVDDFYNSPENFDGWFLILANLLFTFQILLDFSGYCLMAIGMAQIMGIQLSNNFNKPYLATSIADFWRRWHITLHIWFKKYVYQKINKGWIIGSFVVFILSGLWHGLNPHFLMWGLICFLIFVIDRVALQRLKFKPLNWLLTFLLISFSWIFFRVENIDDLTKLLHLHFDSGPIKLFVADAIYALNNFKLDGFLIYGSHDFALTFADWFILILGLPLLAFVSFLKQSPPIIRVIGWFLILCFLGYNGSTPFIYLRF